MAVEPSLRLATETIARAETLKGLKSLQITYRIAHTPKEWMKKQTTAFEGKGLIGPHLCAFLVGTHHGSGATRLLTPSPFLTITCEVETQWDGAPTGESNVLVISAKFSSSN